MFLFSKSYTITEDGLEWITPEQYKELIKNDNIHIGEDLEAEDS
tara:strand:- start:438 stop:569 length:132 start_codon:yes stop_codon:yes gene_type:complete